jgi:hypothetical protein
VFVFSLDLLKEELGGGGFRGREAVNKRGK